MLRLIDWIYRFIMKHPLVFWACMAFNTVGVIWGGWIWYGPMLLESPLWAWPFIPDCPEAALWATIAFLLLRYRGARTWFTAFAAFACIKYGLWTVFFWLRHWSEAGFVPDYYPMEVMLFVSHIGLTAEGILLARQIGPLNLPSRMGIIGWYVLSIYIDYGLGFHPPVTYAVPVEYVFWLATVLTVILGLGLLLLPLGDLRRSVFSETRPST